MAAFYSNGYKIEKGVIQDARSDALENFAYNPYQLVTLTRKKLATALNQN